MKTRIFSLFLLLTITVSFAQKRKGRIHALKAAYITEKLELTPEEAEKFWPVYNAYEKKMHTIKIDRFKNVQQKIRESGGIDSISDEDAGKYLKMIVENDLELIRAKEKLINDLKSVIPPQKILLLYQAERDFNKKLLEEYRKKRH